MGRYAVNRVATKAAFTYLLIVLVGFTGTTEFAG